jgi:uncharacterized protein
VRRLFPILLLILWPRAATAALPEVPKLAGYVNDYAGMISAGTRSELEATLAAFERSDSTQVVILTVPSLQGESIETFGIRVGEAWKIGQKGKDNGAIILVSRDDRRMRIEVGRGLEGTLTDLLTGRIVDTVMKPRFQRGDLDGGFKSAVTTVIGAVRGEFKAEEPRPGRGARGVRPNNLLAVGFVLFFAVMFLSAISRLLGGVAGAAGLPLAVSLLFGSLGLIPLLILAGLGLGGGLFLPRLMATGGTRGTHGGPGGWFIGGPGMGGFGGGLGGGGFGGGGFSGGGGSFGGGGSSGSW